MTTVTKSNRGNLVADARDMLRAHPEGLTSKKIARKLLHLKSAPDKLADALIKELLGGREEFECDGVHWRLAARNPVDLNDVPFVVVDIETTGGHSETNRVIEVAAFRVYGGRIVAGMTKLINPGRPIPLQISYLTGIYDVHVAEAPAAYEVMPGFLDFLGDSIFVAHSARFDFGFLNSESARCGLPPICNETVCTVKLARRVFPGEVSYGLSRMIERFSIEIDPRERHRGHGDAWATAKLLLLCLDRLRGAGVTTLDELLTVLAMPPKRVANKYGLK
jgi:DNA polymerase III epsilon subunit family exonuclease